MDKKTAIQTMATQWNERAEENAYHYIASEKDVWHERDFFESGERDVARHVDPFLREMNLDPTGKRMVEIGCGVGRMTFALAKRFGEVHGVDISSEMIQRAMGYKEKLGFKNVSFQLGSGNDLLGLSDGSFDFCFSFIVLQHIPDPGIIRNYVSEMGRVLKVGGLYRFQVNGYPHLRLPRNIYLIAGVRETGRLRQIGVMRRPFVLFGKLNTMDGAPMRVADLKTTCAASGLSTDKIEGEWSQYMWVGGRRS